MYLTRQTLLLRAMNQHDSNAWEELIEFYTNYIYVIIRSMGIDKTQVDDVLQLVLVNLWKNLSKYEYRKDQSKFRYWIAKLTRNIVINHMRKEGLYRAKLAHIKENSDSANEESEVERLAVEEWHTFVCNMALDNIAESFTESAIASFRLHLKGLAAKEVAEKLDLKQDTVYKNISRVKVKLIQEIQRLKAELDI